MFDLKLHSPPGRSPLHFAASAVAHSLLLLALGQISPPAPSPALSLELRDSPRVALVSPPPAFRAKMARPRRVLKRTEKQPERALMIPSRLAKAEPRRAAIPYEAPRVEAAPASVPVAMFAEPPSLAIPKPAQPKPGFANALASKSAGETPPAQPRKGMFSAAAVSPGASLQIERAEIASTGFGGARVGAVDGKPGPSVGSVGGFGGVSASASASPKQTSTVAQAGFGAVESRRETGRLDNPSAVAPVDLEPVRILSKPEPVYTDEARALRLEGDVAVEALFTAAGRIEQIRVLRGLGHGLDEAAVAAVESIEFEPARRAGVAEDARLRLTVRFQLAY